VAHPVESRRGLPGDPEDMRSRYIEALINGLRIGCLYLPDGNPTPGPKFDYKLRWLERMTKHAQELLATAEPVVLARDYNVIPTDIDVFKPERWLDDALFLPEVRSAFANLVAMGSISSISPALSPLEHVAADLIVMPTHGDRGIVHMMMGSVAERVVREAKRPVLTIRSGFGAAVTATS
jgi:exodeoxyribonuclease-3